MDILIRTSGEIRLSDFMLWQSSRACHIEFLDCYWPEFTFWKLLPIVLRYQLRAISIGQSRLEYEQQDEIVPPSSTAAESDGRPGAELGSVATEKRNVDNLGPSIAAYTSTSKSTFSIATTAVSCNSSSKEKSQRVAEFLAQRGHIPNCPLVPLQ